MIRILFILIGIISVSDAKFKQDFPFLGISLSTQTIDINDEERSRETAFGIRYGQQSLDWRTTFALDHQNSFNSVAVHVDNILLDKMFGTPKLRPYLGACVGYIRFDEDELQATYEETNGFYFGGNFGFIIYANDDIDVDLGYHYYKVNNLDFIEDLHGATLAIHYFF